VSDRDDPTLMVAVVGDTVTVGEALTVIDLVVVQPALFL
jgi:hypothetical protein